MPSHLVLSGSAEILLIKNGVVVQRVLATNSVVNSGLDLAMSQIVGLTTTPVLYMALGSSPTPVANTQVALVAEAQGGVRQLCTLTPSSPGIMLFTGIWANAQNANTTINELGLFSANNVMFSRLVLPSTVTKDQYSQLQVNYQITASIV